MSNSLNSPSKANSSKKKKKQPSSIKTTSISSPANDNSSLIDSLNDILASPHSSTTASTPQKLEKPVKTAPIIIPKESNFNLITNSFNLLLKLFFGWISAFTWSLIPYILLLAIIISLGYYSLNLLRNFIPSLPTFDFPFKSFPLPSLASFPSFSTTAASILPTLSTYYCSSIGIGCSKSQALKRETELSNTAREVRQQAVQALDIFQSVLAITDDTNGKGENGIGSSLVHTGIWELGVAVKNTYSIPNKEFIGEQLIELGDLTRDVKDEIVRLNSHSINSFTWILNEFSRIESLLAPPSISSPSSNSPSRHSSSHQELPVLLSSLFQKLSTDLSSLLLILDRAIPLADRASDLGGKLFAELYSQGSNLQRNKEQKEDWRIYLPSLGSNWESKAIKRDLNVMEIGVENVKNLRYNLELTRINLMSYSNNVGHFKAGLIGFHIAGQGLSAEEEILALKSVMSDFRTTVDQAKKGSRITTSKSKALPGST